MNYSQKSSLVTLGIISLMLVSLCLFMLLFCWCINFYCHLMFLQEVKNVQVLIDIFSVFRLLVSSVIPRDKSFLKWREKLKYPSVKGKLWTNRKQSRLSRFKRKQGNHRVRPPKTYVSFRTDSLCFSCCWVASFSLCFTFFLCFSLFSFFFSIHFFQLISI